MDDDSFEREHSRADDPDTSKVAARNVERKARKHAFIVLLSLRTHGPGDFDTIAARTGLTCSQVWRRLPDLERAGLAYPTESITNGRRVWCAGLPPALDYLG